MPFYCILHLTKKIVHSGKKITFVVSIQYECMNRNMLINVPKCASERNIWITEISLNESTPNLNVESNQFSFPASNFSHFYSILFVSVPLTQLNHLTSIMTSLSIPSAPLSTLRQHLLCRMLRPLRPDALLQEARPSVWWLLWRAPGLMVTPPHTQTCPLQPPAPRSPEGGGRTQKLQGPLRNSVLRWSHDAANQIEGTLN